MGIIDTTFDTRPDSDWLTQLGAYKPGINSWGDLWNYQNQSGYTDRIKSAIQSGNPALFGAYNKSYGDDWYKYASADFGLGRPDDFGWRGWNYEQRMKPTQDAEWRSGTNDDPAGWYVSTRNDEDGGIRWSRFNTGNEGGEGSFDDTENLNPFSVRNLGGLSKLPTSPVAGMSDADLFKKIANGSAHFTIDAGAGYAPYSFDQWSDPSTWAKYGVGTTKDGKAVGLQYKSLPKQHGLGELATMMPVFMGSAFMGGALGGAFPGVDAAGSYMAPGTTGLSWSSALGINNAPSWLSSGIDRLGNSLLSSGIQGKNPLDNPMGLAMPFLKGGLGELGSIFGGGTDMADTFNTTADSWIENTSNTFDGGNMDDWGSYFDGWDFGPGNMYDNGSYGDLFAQPSGWDFGPAADSYFGYEGTSYPTSSWWDKLMPSGDTLLKLGMMGLGGALGGVNGSKQSGTTTTTSSNVPDWALPYAQGILAQGAGVNAAQGYNAVPMDLANLAAGQLGKTIGGQYLNLANNPQWQDLSREMADKYKLGTAANRDAQFSRANAMGSTAYGEQKALDNQAYGRSLAGLAGTIYGQERTNQERAATIAPDWTRSYQQVPYGNLSAYKGLLSGWGGSSSAPYYTNPYSGILGGMSAVGSLFGSNSLFGK